MKTYAIRDPTFAPTIFPIYTPGSPQSKTNANNTTKRISKMADLKMVSIKDSVPLPIDWNKEHAILPNGISNTKKHKMRKAPTIWGAKTELS